MAKISLICEQCGGNIILDNSHKFGTCEHCYAQFVVKEDKIIQHITQNITKHVFGIEGKDVEDLLNDAYNLKELGDEIKANYKFKQALNIDPNCWSAWLGYASTGGDRSGYLSIVPAYRKAYALTLNEKQELDTFVDMLQYLPDRYLCSAFIRIFNTASQEKRAKIFMHVSSVIGCDESEIATLAIDLCPNDWRAYFAMAKFRKIRARWCQLEGGFFSEKHLPAHAMEVLNIFMNAYRLAKSESNEAQNIILSYINSLENDESYRIFATELIKYIKREH